MILKKTYEQPEIHAVWESAFRSHPLERGFNDEIMERLLENLRPPAQALFLDAGCGIGDHALRIAEHGYRCVGVDLSQHVLRMAVENSQDQGLAPKIMFTCQAMEELAFPNHTFDVIHCRGVLMHIPDWEKALSNLCRVLKPGGRIAVVESNSAGVEMLLVRLVRALTRRESRMQRTPAGLEFWSEEGGAPFLVRFADQDHLREHLGKAGVAYVKRFSTSFWDINRFPAGMLRTAAIQFNRVYFRLRLPALFAIGNALIGEKQKPLVRR